MTIKANVREQQTVVKTIVVGTPIRRVSSSSSVNVDDIIGISTAGRADGAVLIWNSSTEQYEPKTEISNENTSFNGGNF